MPRDANRDRGRRDGSNVPKVRHQGRMASMGRLRLAAAAGAAATLLAGCGGGGDAPAPARTATAAAQHLDGGDPRVLARLRRAALRRNRRRQATAPAPAPAPHAPRTPVAARRPPVVARPIPFGAKRRAEMAAYAQRHYALSTYRLRDPKVIVEHYTETPDFQSTYNTFAPDRPDVELHELPNVCSHFVVDRDGTIYQLVPTSIMCRHTVGLNWTAIGIEHVGYRDSDVLNDRRQFRASLALTRWLRCRYGIPTKGVVGHNESLSSPYHRERVAALRSQTHSDMQPASMAVYRARLHALGACPA